MRRIIPSPNWANQINQFNAAVPGIVEERATAGAHIIYVDQFTDFPESELADSVHPHEAGYARMATVWFETIESYLP